MTDLAVFMRTAYLVAIFFVVNVLYMKKNKLLFLLLPAFVCGCSSDEIAFPENVAEGKISLNLDIDADVISATTVPERRSVVDIPQINDFKLALKSNDGTLVNEWISLSSFNQNESYKIGSYFMEAFYGDVSDEGFEKPCFYGSEEFEITEASTTQVNITCTLANTMVSVGYTDAFKGFFTDYAVSVVSSTGTKISYAKSETRAAYFVPGSIKLNISVTKYSGATATYQVLLNENALARHHYHATLDVNNGEMRQAKLIVKFDDTLASEDVIIDLSDEIMSCPAPEVYTEGFGSGQPISLEEGVVSATPVKMTINARGGLKSVVLNHQSQLLTAAGLSAEVDLMSIDKATQEVLVSLGLDVKGLWSNPDQMAVIDFTSFLSQIKTNGVATQSIFNVVVKDGYDKISDTISLIVNTTPKQ